MIILVVGFLLSYHTSIYPVDRNLFGRINVYFLDRITITAFILQSFHDYILKPPDNILQFPPSIMIVACDNASFFFTQRRRGILSLLLLLLVHELIRLSHTPVLCTCTPIARQSLSRVRLFLNHVPRSSKSKSAALSFDHERKRQFVSRNRKNKI